MSSANPGSLCRLAAVGIVLLSTFGCAQGVPTGANQPFFYPSRITVQDLALTPSVAAVGSPIRIAFRLVRAGDEGKPIYWTAHVLERPDAGGTLSLTSGGPLASGDRVEIVYTPPAPTMAFITLYPSSTRGTATGDGSGDWRSFTIEVK